MRALKNGEPTVCLNCGAFSRVNEKGDGLELCNNPYGGGGIMDESGAMEGASLFDALFGGMGAGGEGMSDFIGVSDSSNTSTTSGKEDQVKKAKREGTIIDVDIERD